MSEKFTPDIPPEENVFETGEFEYPDPMQVDRRDDLCLAGAIQASLYVVQHPELFSEQYVAGHEHYLERYGQVHNKRYQRIRKQL